MTKVKICGIKSIEDVEKVNMLMPEYVGFVFAKSKRQILDSQAKRLKEALHPEIKTVGVFVNEPIEHVVSLCREGMIDCVQLHGDESVEYAKTLQGRVDQPVIKAIRVQSRQQIMGMMDYPCDYFLFDTYQKDSYGGTGNTFDLTCIPQISKPYFIAGGLHADNVEKIIKGCNPYCVDVSSGVETEGRKDDKKMSDFIRAVRKEQEAV